MSLLSRLAVQAAKAYGALSKGGVSASYLVVAGGGAGAYHNGAGGGGGGAGGYLTGTTTLSILNTYSITVGAGGAIAGNYSAGGNGSNSVLSGTGLTTITSTGGGGGGPQNTKGNAGGSGGGATYNGGSTGGNSAGNTPATTPSQGNNGGTTANSGAAGGGGAGAVGSDNSGANGGAGGAGTASSISGSSVTYAGGGGGGSNGATGGTGGTGGGGAGANSSATGTSGTTNLGGGGGGATYNSPSPYAGAGGSGVVIISYTSATPKFVGGTLTTSGGNQIHTFTSSGTLSPLTPVTASYLVVAGGGGGGSNSGGGAGAGGLLTSSTTLYSGATYVVTVGAGGAGGASGGNNTGSNGSDSIVSGTGLTTVTSTGGGGGGKNAASPNGSNGGSGGGGGSNGATLGTGGTGVSGQGFAGGTAATDNSTYRNGGGGGGASAVGSNGTSSVGGAGGNGSSSSISGSSITYAGGGGGASFTTGGAGGTGGGGAGTGGTGGAAGTSGTTNLGGGGGGGAGGNGGGGAGGSGTVIISYAGSQVFNGGLVTSSGGNTIHTFNATGALTPVTNNLTNSLRFRASATAYLSRTPAGAGNRKTWTWSGWVKRGLLGTAQGLYAATNPVTGSGSFGFVNSPADSFYLTLAGTGTQSTTAVFRDPSAWYHVVLTFDSTQAIQANRCKLYINGVQYTFTTNIVALNTDYEFNNNTAQQIGTSGVTGITTYTDGYLADVNFIDGQALEPYYFGNNDAYGNWKPIKYTGMYGTNGFYLTFADASAATAAAIGKDSSPNGNNWTPSGISVTAGVTYDAMLDVPTNTSATVANYAVLNPLWKSSILTLAGANLNVTSSGVTGSALSTIAMESGKYYCEATINTGSDATIVGIANSLLNPTTTSISATGGVGYYGNNGEKYVNGTSSAYGATYTTGDIIGIALDITAGTITFYKNNTSQGAITHGLTGPFYFATSDASSGSNIDQSWNFGQRPFSYTPPSGFVRLNTFNLPTPTILQGNKYMDATLYTGTATVAGANTITITNQAGFKPDFVWAKGRSIAYAHGLFNSVVGAEKFLVSSNTNAELVNEPDGYLTSFNSNGFTLGNGSNSNLTFNSSPQSYVAWQWQAGQGTNTSNTSGSITSTVSVNATAGFSVVTYTGTGANATVGHGLGVAPKMVIIKYRSGPSGGWLWFVFHNSLSNYNYALRLNSSDLETQFTNGFQAYPTSSVFSMGSEGAINYSGNAYVAYCWSEIAGFSKFGSYTGNGSTDGVFIYLGFRPKFIITKVSSTSGYNWNMYDSSRGTYNAADQVLVANANVVEETGYDPIDFLSNGFKLRMGNRGSNVSGATYIYMAFAENPFKNANAR